MSLKILNLKIENVKKLVAVDITPSKNLITIFGKCEQGKTTILDAIWMALGGKTEEQPIRKGQKKASIRLDLGELIVTRIFTESGSRLTVTTKGGNKFSSPQAVLDKLLGELTFDPLAFARGTNTADKHRRAEMLLRVVDINVDTQKLEKISGVAVEKISNPIDMLNIAYKSVFDERTLTNRDLDKAKKTIEDYADVDPVDPVSVVELVTEKERLEKINRDNAKNVAEYQDQVAHSAILEKDKATISNKIEDLEEQLKIAKDNLSKKINEIISHEESLKAKKFAIGSQKDEDLTEINTRIANADETNKKAQRYAEKQKIQNGIDISQADSDALTTKLDAIKKYKKEIMENTKFPIPNLDFANNGVIFEGLPFEQASSAQRYRISVAIGMALNPDLRVMLFDGGESLDDDQMKIVENLAAENDYQIWMTKVDGDCSVGIYTEDGEIKNELCG